MSSSASASSSSLTSNYSFLELYVNQNHTEFNLHPIIVLFDDELRKGRIAFINEIAVKFFQSNSSGDEIEETKRIKAAVALKEQKGEVISSNIEGTSFVVKIFKQPFYVSSTSPINVPTHTPTPTIPSHLKNRSIGSQSSRSRAHSNVDGASVAEVLRRTQYMADKYKVARAAVKATHRKFSFGLDNEERAILVQNLVKQLTHSSQQPTPSSP